MNEYSKTVVFRIILLVSILLAISPGNVLHAQQRVSEIVIPEEGVDYSNFPAISVRAIVSDETRSRVLGLTEADFTLREDGQETPFALSEVEVGIQVVFVLDASLSTRQAGSTGYTRLEEGKQVIYNFAEERMAEGVDRVTVLAPGPEGAIQRVAPLPEDPADYTSFKNTVRDGTYLYELPQGVGGTPLNDMVSTALNLLAGAEGGLHRALVVISDGVDVISDREVADTVNTANQLHVPIYTVIFGPSGNWGGQAESNMRRLSLDSHGEHFRLEAEARKPEPIEELISQAVEPLYEKLVSQRSQYLLSWTSAIFTPGSHELALAVSNRSTKRAFSLNVRPPEVAISEPTAGARITRSTDDPELPVEDIEPRTQSIAFEITWPDGFPREIEMVDLLVDGVAATDACAPPCDRITWNITSLAAGAHSIRVRVRDQQGMSAESDEVPLTISIITPTPVPTPVPTPRPTPTPVPAAPTCEEMYTGVTRIVRCNPEIGSYAALGIALIALVLVVILIRRPPQVVGTMVQRVKDATEPFFPQRAKIKVRPPGEVLGTLVVLDGDDSYTEPIELVGESIRLGRDEDLAQVAFRNRSVSRLHARISVEVDRAGEQRLMLYDEGSTSGTYVNYEPVGINGQALQHGDMINLGQVQLKIQVKPKAPPVPVHDDTIAMAPVHPGTVTDTVVGQREDEFATAPYEPLQPEPSLDDTQPFASRTPGPAPAPPPPPEPEDEEGVSTEPYVPMDFDE